MNVLGSPSNFLVGAGQDLLASTRSSFWADRQREKTDSPIRVRGTGTQVEGRGDGPLAGALLAGLVEDQVDHRLAGGLVVEAEDVAGDLDQVAIERALVPAGEDLVELGGVEPDQRPS